MTDGQPTCGMNGTGTFDPEQVTLVNEAVAALARLDVSTYVIGLYADQDPALTPLLDGFAQHGRTEKHYPADSEDSVREQLVQIGQAVRGCEYTLSRPVAPHESVEVSLGAEALRAGSDYAVDGSVLTLTAACAAVRAVPSAPLTVTASCR